MTSALIWVANAAIGAALSVAIGAGVTWLMMWVGDRFRDYIVRSDRGADE